MRLIDADALIGALHDHAFLEGDDRSIAYNVIQKQPTVGGWISVKDRLPERPHDVEGPIVRRKWYLVALESGAVLTNAYEFDDDRWLGIGSPVTHWMPLPKAPEEGNVG